MNFDDNPQEAAFRAEAKAWIEANAPKEFEAELSKASLGRIRLQKHDIVEVAKAWQKKKAEGGWVCLNWPKEYGGRGASAVERVIWQQEEGIYFKLTSPFQIGEGMCGPTLMAFGSEADKRRYLPKIASGEEIWCQGFSEPGAGSDLASVQTFAQFSKGEAGRGDEWIINGHKVWTSLAHVASWMILLARTDKADKYNGLTFFVVPIKAALGKGVTVRPLIKASGGTGFNEVLFENLVIPDRYRLDAVGKGWTVAMTTLTHERGAGQLVMPSSGGQSDVDYSNIAGVKDVIALAKKRGVAADAVIRDQLMQLLIRDTAMMQAMRLSQVKALVENPARIQLQGKLVVTELQQEAAELALDIAGPASTLYTADAQAPDKGRWPLTYINSFANTIAAGSSEVQRNILGERVLGLPKSK